MELLVFIIVPTSILMALAFILYENNIGKYKLKYSDENKIEEENFCKFQKDFPEKDIKDLKIEIEKISDMLLDNQDSNRYTGKLQEKAKNDNRLDIFRDLIPDNVEIIKYNQGKMKAHVNYIFGKQEYTLVMNMNIVKKGRAFLKKYKTIKRVISVPVQKIVKM